MPRSSFLPIVLILSAILAVASGFLIYRQMQIQKLLSAPANYEECLQSPGSLLQESYPATCVAKNGARFVQPLTDEEQQSLEPPDETENWETYPSSTTIGLPYSFKYPQTTEMEEAQNLVYLKTGNATIYHRFLSKQTDLINAMNNFKPWGTNEQVVFSNEKNEINYDLLTGYKLTSVDQQNTFLFLSSSKLNGILVFHYPTVEAASGQLLDQILSTFKFLPED